MKKLILTLALLFSVISFAFPQLTLKVEITGLSSNNGKIMIQLFDEKQNPIQQSIGDITEKTGQFTFAGLRPGRYAVRFYHDENLNRVMDTNLFGKPTEGYGFSNNVKEKFSMPPFEKWLFDLDRDMKITINTVY